MENKAKEKRQYVIINCLLLLITILLGIYLYKIIQSNKQQIKVGYEQGVNFVQQLQEGTLNVESSDISLAKNNVNIEIKEDIKYSEEYKFDNVFNNKYYYNQLDDCAKLIYDTIENNLYNMTAGNYEMELSNEISDVLYEDNGEEKLDYSFQSAWDALTQDRTDTFFIDITNVNLKIKKTTYGNKVNYALSIAPDSNEGYLLKGLENKQTVHAVLNSIREQRDSIISNAIGSDYDKILQVHDWIIDNLEYESNIENSNVYNLYGALIEKKAVCEGYAEAFKYILDEMRIPCILVSGTATNSEGTTERHEWNYVQIDNKWYAVDSTWDDPVVKGFGYVSNSVKHKYFLIGSRKINRNHFVNGQMTQNGQSFIYPKLESDNYK